jgi:dipeptidyl aminopeptidase/acylaminoacyl peptidase
VDIGARRSARPGSFYQALISHGVDSELVIYPAEGHGVRRFPAVTDYLTWLVTWFERYMPA